MEVSLANESSVCSSDLNSWPQTQSTLVAGQIGDERAPIERRPAGEVARVVNHRTMRRLTDAAAESFHFWQVRIIDEASGAAVVIC